MPKVAGKQVKNNSITSTQVNGSIAVTGSTNTFGASQNMGGFNITNLPSVPGSGDSAACKTYVDTTVAAVAQGLDPKASVRAATATSLPPYVRTGNTINGTAVPLGVVDDVTLVAGVDRVLVQHGASGADNGIYDVVQVTSPYILTRSPDADTSAKVTNGMWCFATAGTANGLKGWVLVTQDPIVLNTTELTFSQSSQSPPIAYGNVTAISVGGNNVNGVADSASHSDHVHGLAAAVPGAVAVADVVGEGTANSVARSDHRHSVARGTPVNVGTANAAGTGVDFAAGNHVHASPKLNVGNKNMACIVTTNNGDKATNTTIATANALGANIAITLNGLDLYVTETNSGECYIGQGDTSTARAFSAVVPGDTVRWNQSVAGFNLETTDVLNVHYLSF